MINCLPPMTDCTQVSHFWWVPNVVLAHEKDGIEALRLVNLVAQSTKVVGGNGAEQTVLTPEWIRGSTATLLGNTNLWRSGVPVQEQLFNASSCLHYSPCNLVHRVNCSMDLVEPETSAHWRLQCQFLS
uniref:Uncharacterized protein n=1 Tax=Opuntia streptacantha TaxID=393608 RepID=A0A7C8YRH3_OPUST